MYSQGAALLRSDLRGVVEEAFLQSTLFIGAKVLPPLPVPDRAGQYPYIGKAAAGLLKNNAKRRGPGADYARTNRSFTNDNYTCIEYGSEAVVADDNAKDVGRFFDLEASETRWKYREVQLAHELRAKATVFAPATFNLTTSATAYTEAAAGTFDIGLDVDTAKQAIQSRGESPDGLSAVMSLSVFNRVRASTRLQNRARGIQSTSAQLVLDAQAVAEALGLKEVIVGAGAYDTSGEGAATVSMSNIWTDTYIWLGQIKAAAGPQDYFAGGTGYTLFWQADAGEIFTVESYREEQKRASIIRCRQTTDEKIVNASSAQLLVTQYS